MELSCKESFQIGDWQVEPSLNLISRDGAAVNLRPRAMDLLIYMSSRPGEVVSVDDIIEQVWSGVFVAQGSIYNCVNELRQAFGDDAQEPSYIETIAKRGYRMIAAVSGGIRSSDLGATAGAVQSETDHSEPGKSIQRGWLATAAMVFGAVILAAIYWLPGGAPPSSAAARPTLAVLPFVNMSEEPDNEFFSDGIADEIITALVRNDALNVIGRTSSFAFKGKPQDLRDIGEILGAGYIVEGSVRRVGDQVQVTAQLVEAASGLLLWSDTYDRELQDIFAVQGEISRAVVGALEIELINEDNRPTGLGSTNPEAYQAYLRGRYFWNRRSPEALLKAIEYFERAIEIAPDYAAAYHGLADAHLLLLVTGGDPLPYSDRFALGLAANEKALELDPDYGPAYSTLALINLIQFRLDEIIPNSEKAAALAPNDPTTPHWMVMNTEFLGYSTNTLALMQQAVALDPLSVAINLSYSETLFLAGQYEDSIAQYKETVTLAPGHEWPLLSLGKAYLQLGRYEEARGMADTIDNAKLAAIFRSWIDLIEGKTVLEEHDPRVDRLISEFGGRGATTLALLVMAGFNNRAIGYFEESAKAGLMLTLPVRIGSDPIIRRLFGEPRFQAFLRQVGFVDYWNKNGWPDGCEPPEAGEFKCS